MNDWAVTAAISEHPPASEFQAAADVARAHVEALEPQLAEQYAAVLRRAGRRAARQFRMSAVLHPVMVAAGDLAPSWTVPPVDELIDTVQVEADLLSQTGATRQAAAVAATRPIMSAMGVSFSLQSPLVKDLVGRTGVRAMKISIPGLRDAVISAMTEAFSEGLSVPDTASLILSKTDDLADFQATMLARTDLIGTANGGSLLAAKVVYPQGTIVKRWVNATDSNTETDGRIRDTHLEANGQTVPLDGFFTVGGDQLLYPGDPSGADEEVINCRCTLVYDDPVRDLNAAAWDESKHPRFHSGVREGGRFKTAAERAREAKAMRDSVEMDVPPNLERRDRMPSETISEVDRAKARRALSYTSDDGLLLRVRDANSWDNLSGEDRRSLARYLEDVQDETDHENLQPLIDRLRKDTGDRLPPRGSYPVTAAAEWDTLAAARPDVSELAMIAVYPRVEEQQAVSVEGGNDPEKMHVTLVFLGEAAGLDEDAIVTTMEDIGRVFAPLEGKVGGVGRFAAGEDGVPIIALPSVKGLAELRAVIVDALQDQGIESPTEHGWTPHLTLQYVEEEDGKLPAVPDVPLHFDQITYSKGDIRRDFTLEGTVSAAVDQNNWGFTATGWEAPQRRLK